MPSTDGPQRKHTFCLVTLFASGILSLLFPISLALGGGWNPDSLNYPLTEGTSWTYRGRAKWTIPNSSKVETGAFRWTSEVVKTLSAYGVTAAVLRGDQFEMGWYEPEKKPGYSVMVQTRKGLFEREADSESQALELAQSAIHRQDESDLLVKYPIQVGDCVASLSGDPLQTAKGEYCWCAQSSDRQLWSWMGADHGHHAGNYSFADSPSRRNRKLFL